MQLAPSTWSYSVQLAIEHSALYSFVVSSPFSFAYRHRHASIEERFHLLIMFDKLISQNYLLVLLNIDPTHPSALSNSNLLNIRNVYASLITINREAHVWYQEVYHALEKVQFGGSLGTNGLLIKGTKKNLSIVKRTFCQRLLQAPYGFVISDLGKNGTCAFDVVGRTARGRERAGRGTRRRSSGRRVDDTARRSLR